ncbi:uncharacterized protein LOC122275480 [Carya illinoinensis]|uniref:uncharacterized protein LOC122275480 n=1 Tax=Carya illinoinensis TaxID=32201 RepID=UPI001C7258C2|nr:uncharacterized protein LOC122275480 [Carya illinoinensis]
MILLFLSSFIRNMTHSLVPSPSLFKKKKYFKVFTGCIKDWKALAKWSPSNGGLDYLQEWAGSCTVEATRTRSAPVFYVDLESRKRVSLPFSIFIDYRKQQKQKTKCGTDDEPKEHASELCSWGPKMLVEKDYGVARENCSFPPFVFFFFFDFVSFFCLSFSFCFFLIHADMASLRSSLAQNLLPVAEL